jgi:hypothetical protein
MRFGMFSFPNVAKNYTLISVNENGNRDTIHAERLAIPKDVFQESLRQWSMSEKDTLPPLLRPLILPQADSLLLFRPPQKSPLRAWHAKH